MCSAAYPYWIAKDEKSSMNLIKKVVDRGSYLEFTPAGQQPELGAAGDIDRPLVGVSRGENRPCVVSWLRS